MVDAYTNSPATLRAFAEAWDRAANDYALGAHPSYKREAAEREAGRFYALAVQAEAFRAAVVRAV